MPAGETLTGQCPGAPARTRRSAISKHGQARPSGRLQPTPREARAPATPRRDDPVTVPITRPACLDASSLASSLGFLVRLAQQAMFEEFHRRAGDHGMTPARYSLLCLLRDNPGSPMTVLATALRIKPPNFAVLVGDMEEDGLVIRQLDPADRRRNLLALSPHGEATLQALAPEIEAMEAALHDRLGPRLLASVKAGLERLLTDS